MDILIEQGILRGQVDELSKGELLSLYQRNNSGLDEQGMRAAILKKKGKKVMILCPVSKTEVVFSQKTHSLKMG